MEVYTMSVCMYVCVSHISELFKAVYKRPSFNCLIQFLQDGLYQAAIQVKSSQICQIRQIRSVVADSNPGWTLCVGSQLCIPPWQYCLGKMCLEINI